MSDKRKNNGGNSTKSVKTTDKRKSVGRDLIDKYINEDFDYERFKEMMEKLFKSGIEGDTKSSSLFLAYILGRPKETKDITTNGNDINISPIEWVE